MDAVRAVSAVLWSTALQVATALEDAARALIGWVTGIASRNANIVVILGQSVTLFLLTIAVGYLRKPETRVKSRCLRGPEKS